MSERGECVTYAFHLVRVDKASPVPNEGEEPPTLEQLLKAVDEAYGDYIAALREYQNAPRE